MHQLELLSIDSPCIGRCESNKKGYCKGCFRSRQERFDWLNFTPEQRGLVLQLCKQRRRRALSAKKKREAEQLDLLANIDNPEPQSNLFNESARDNDTDSSDD